MRLTRSNGHLCVAIEDDGGGIQAPRDEGVGLESMRKRASEIGGRVSVECTHPHGTVITAMLPLGSR